MTGEIAITIEQEHLVSQNVDWDVLETHKELHEFMEQDLNPDTGKRWWSARKFAEKMEMQWHRFEELILNAKKQVHSAFGEPERHFYVYVKTSVDRIGRAKTDPDYRLSTYAVYLILMITRKDTEFVRKAKANFSMLTEIGRTVVETESGRRMMVDGEIRRLSLSRVEVSEIGLDATDAIQMGLNIEPGTPWREQMLPDGTNPFKQYRIIIKLLLTGLYPYQIKRALGENLKVPTQDLMTGSMLDCETLMHDRIARKIRREIQISKKLARKNNVQWNGLEWETILQIIYDVGKQTVDDCFRPEEIEKSLWGSDVGMKLLEARKTVEQFLLSDDKTDLLEV